MRKLILNTLKASPLEAKAFKTNINLSMRLVTIKYVLVNKQFNDVISSWVGYSFSKNDYTFDSLNNGNSFPNNFDIRHALTFAGTYTYNDIKFALGLNWHSGKPTTQPVMNDKAPNSDNLKDYLRADCSATYDFDISNRTHATIGASIWNVLNKKNVINTYYTADDKDVVTKVENQSLGITPNVSFRLQF